MGMIGYVYAVDANLLDRLLDGSADIEAALDHAEVVDLDKAWHGIHFLLTGEAWAGEAPLDFLVGGEQINDVDLGCGPARYHHSSSVRTLAGELLALSTETFLDRFDREDFASAEIYPDGCWTEDMDEDNLEYLGANYSALRSFVLAAAERSQALIVLIR